MTLKLALIHGRHVQPVSSPATSIAEAALLEPEGVYTVARTYAGDHVVLLDAHLDRLERSASEEGMSVSLDRPALRAALRELIESSGFAETRFRLTIPRAEPGDILAALEPLPVMPAELRQSGVPVRSVAYTRQHPSVKTNRQENVRAQIRESLPAGTFEGLIVGPDGEILEGLSSNFFAVMAGSLYTAGTGVLEGISRRIVLEVAPDLLPVILEPVSLSEVGRLDEAFLSSSSRGVIPIVNVDGTPIGAGRPGSATLAISQAYDAWVTDHLQPI